MKVLPNGDENGLQRIVTHNVLDCILDLLHYSEGPRIRDKLSHGEVDLETFTNEFVCHIIGLSPMGMSFVKRGVAEVVGI